MSKYYNGSAVQYSYVHKNATISGSITMGDGDFVANFWGNKTTVLQVLV